MTRQVRSAAASSPVRARRKALVDFRRDANSPAVHLLGLQRSAGNAAVGALVGRVDRQADLTAFGLGDPGFGTPSAAPSRLLRVGSSGPDVADLQTELNQAGAEPPLQADGQFGPRTRAAVVEFQRANGLDPDGVVGPQTRRALDGAATGAEQPLLKGHDQDVPTGGGGLEVLTRDGDGGGGGQTAGAGGLLGFAGKPSTSKGEDQSQMAGAGEIGGDALGMLMLSAFEVAPGRGTVVVGLLARLVGLPPSFTVPQIADDPPGSATMDPMVRALVVVTTAVEALQTAVAADPTVHPNVAARLQVFDAFFTRRRDAALGGEQQGGSRIAVVTIAMAEIGKVDEKSTGGPPCDTIGHESKATRYGWPRLEEYFDVAIGNNKKPNPESWRHPQTNDAFDPPDWCTIFLIWAFKAASIPVPDWRIGGGIGEVMQNVGTPATVLPKPGDVAHKAAKDHTGLVIDVAPSPDGNLAKATITTVDGNTLGSNNQGGQVSLNENPASVYDAYFSPDPKRAPGGAPVVF